MRARVKDYGRRVPEDLISVTSDHWRERIPSRVLAIRLLVGSAHPP